MIRLFTALCKAFLKKLPEERVLLEEMKQFNQYDAKSPCCGATGQLEFHGSYLRSLVYIEDEKIATAHVEPNRFKCSSCNKTHALLPDIIVPYSIYSLRFILMALIAYFERETTVVKVCERFDIAVSTIYEWKKRMNAHKELMLGILISQKTPALEFLKGLLGSARLSHILSGFFSKHAFSFLQRKSAETTRIHPT